jgi:hypothetical protein
MRTLHTLHLLAALTLTTVFTACGSSDQPTIKDHNLVVLVDISGSALAGLESHAPELEAKLLRTLGPNDRLVVLAIDNASETWAKPLFELDMAAHEFVNPNLPSTMRQQVAVQQRAAFLDSVARAFRPSLLAAVAARSGSNKQTDIFGAFTMANKEVRALQHNHLIVLSDMLHESTSLNFDKLLRARKDLLQELPRAPKVVLPFEQVLVFTGDNSAMRDGYYKALETFWKEWFAQNSAALQAYSSGGIRNLIAQHP